MSGLQTACPLHVQAEEISALYDDTLDAAVAARLREHIATCDVCQRRLDAYARISAALREQPVPQPDARLRRGILAARSQPAPAVVRGGRGRDLWRAALVAAAVVLVVGAFASLLLNHIRPGRIANAPTPTATLGVSQPQGWTAILPGSRFSVGGSQGFAVSAARPGRLVGCSVPGDGTDAWPYPVLAISDDGGQTWRQSSFQDIGSVSQCIIVVDQMRPDTFIVGGNGAPGQLAVTTDAGQTWRTLVVPLNMRMNFPGTLVDGQLIGLFHSNSWPARSAIGALSIDGAFRILDARLPYNDATMVHTPLAFAVDPANALHIYVIVADPIHPSSDARLYATYDGGASWQLLHTFPSAQRISLWAPTPDALYLWVSYPEKSPNGNPLQQSVDGGVTWRAITPARYRLDGAWFGPDGRIVVMMKASADAAPTVGRLNPAIGVLTPMGQLPATLPSSTGGFDGAVTGGAHPVFVVADTHTAYVMPLP